MLNDILHAILEAKKNGVGQVFVTFAQSSLT